MLPTSGSPVSPPRLGRAPRPALGTRLPASPASGRPPATSGTTSPMLPLSRSPGRFPRLPASPDGTTLLGSSSPPRPPRVSPVVAPEPGTTLPRPGKAAGRPPISPTAGRPAFVASGTEPSGSRPSPVGKSPKLGASRLGRLPATSPRLERPPVRSPTAGSTFGRTLTRPSALGRLFARPLVRPLPTLPGSLALGRMPPASPRPPELGSPPPRVSPTALPRTSVGFRRLPSVSVGRVSPRTLPTPGRAPSASVGIPPPRTSPTSGTALPSASAGSPPPRMSPIPGMMLPSASVGLGRLPSASVGTPPPRTSPTSGTAPSASVGSPLVRSGRLLRAGTPPPRSLSPGTAVSRLSRPDSGRSLPMPARLVRSGSPAVGRLLPTPLTGAIISDVPILGTVGSTLLPKATVSTAFATSPVRPPSPAPPVSTVWPTPLRASPAACPRSPTRLPVAPPRLADPAPTASPAAWEASPRAPPTPCVRPPTAPVPPATVSPKSWPALPKRPPKGEVAGIKPSTSPVPLTMLVFGTVGC